MDDHEDLDNLIKSFVITKEDISSIKLPRIRKMRVHSHNKELLNDNSKNEDSFLKNAK
jgi:hypothetical protein